MNLASLFNQVEFTFFCGFSGPGGGAAGFLKGDARVGHLRAKFRCLGGFDSDPRCARDFTQRIGVPATLVDLFDRAQYIAYHGQEPPPGWREATPEDIRRAAGYEWPNIVFLSPPCKGFSGLLSHALSLTPKYQALNRLTLRGLWLMLEAFAEDLPEFFFLENVPRIRTRGRDLLDQIIELLNLYGYAAAESEHDCGELGGLGQSRKRFLDALRSLAFLWRVRQDGPKTEVADRIVRRAHFRAKLATESEFSSAGVRSLAGTRHGRSQELDTNKLSKWRHARASLFLRRISSATVLMPLAILNRRYSERR